MDQGALRPRHLLAYVEKRPWMVGLRLDRLAAGAGGVRRGGKCGHVPSERAGQGGYEPGDTCREMVQGAGGRAPAKKSPWLGRLGGPSS